jgi:hypothetical protein
MVIAAKATRMGNCVRISLKEDVWLVTNFTLGSLGYIRWCLLVPSKDTLMACLLEMRVTMASVPFATLALLSKFRRIITGIPTLRHNL